MAYISKIKLNGEDQARLIKDLEAQQSIATLVAEHGVGALGDAAWLGVDNTMADGGTGVATSGLIKRYVDAQVAAITIGEVVIDTASESGSPSTPASADTYRKLYLVADAKATGSYVEWLTIKSGDPAAYTWEQIGTTEMDLSNYVQKNTQIANVAINNGISVADLSAAGSLNLKALSHKDNASGSTTLNTIDSIEMKEMTVAGDATVTYTQTTYTIPASQKGDYTPSGSLLVDNAAQAAGNKVLKGGSISVTMKDADTATAVTDITYDSYTPQGTIAAKNGGSFSALKSAAFEEVETGGLQIDGTISKPAVDLTSASQDVLTGVATAGTLPTFTPGAFTPAAIQEGFFTAGTAAQYSHSGFSGGSFTKGTAVNAVSEGIVASVGENDESETLILTSVNPTQVMSYAASFTPAEYGTDTFVPNVPAEVDTTKFSGGSKAEDNFNAGAMPTFNEGSVNNVTSAALHNAPEFTGKRYNISTTEDTALKDVEFTGTAADIKFKGAKYLKQEVNTAEFNGTEAELRFSGTTSPNLIPTAITYDKADAAASFSIDVTPETETLNRTAKQINITVS